MKHHNLHTMTLLTKVRRAGFTLIELLVVVGVIVVISGVMLANTNKFGGQTLLQNLAYDIALSIRQAQVYGISIKNIGTSQAATPAYGMYFTMAIPTQFYIFADTKSADGSAVPDGAYDATRGENVSPPYMITRGFKIAKICKTDASGEVCSSDPATTLTILFVHPEPDAQIDPTCIIRTEAVGQYSEKCTTNYSTARVVLASPRGDYMSVVVYANGQISVNNSN